MLPSSEPSRRHLIFPGLLLLAGLLVNLIRLGKWAPLPDEVNYALCARSLITGRTLIVRDIMFFPPLFVYLAALLQLAGSELLLSVRLVSAVAGAFVVPLLYLMMLATYPERAARLAALAALPLFALHSYSRLGQVEILLLTIICTAYYLLARSASQIRSHDWVLAGLLLGMALWVKETALGAMAGAILFVLFAPDNRGRRFGLLLLGFLGPAMLLLGFGALTDNNLLFEITAARGHDINMLRLSPLASIAVTAANFGYNLFPRLFSPWEFVTFALLVPALIVILLIRIVRSGLARRTLPLLVLSYLAVHLPFFAVFSRKFDYYLLPAALLTLTVGTAECLSAPAPRRGPTGRRVVLALLGTLVVLNIVTLRLLYWNEGTHASFRSEVLKLPTATTVATSHPTLVRYISDRAGLGLVSVPVFQDSGYVPDWNVLCDTAVRFILVKRSYRAALEATPSPDLGPLAEGFTVMRETVDAVWSVQIELDTIPQPGLLNIVATRLSRLVRPAGVVLFARRTAALP